MPESSIDIDDLKRLEAELRQANERLELALRGSNVGIWDVEVPDGTLESMRTVYTNAPSLLGYDGQESPSGYGESMVLLHPEDVTLMERALQALVSGKSKEIEVTYRVRRKDGSYRWMLTRGIRVGEDARKRVRLIGSDIDITDLKRAEESLRERAAFPDFRRSCHGRVLPV